MGPICDLPWSPEPDIPGAASCGLHVPACYDWAVIAVGALVGGAGLCTGG